MPLAADIYALLGPLIQSFSPRLDLTVKGHAVSGYLRGASEMEKYGTTKLGRPVFTEGPPMQQATRYATRRGARLVTQMDKVTRKRLARTVSDAIKNKRGVDGLARDLRRTFSDMATNRSRTIARTETADALQQGMMDRSKAMGVTGKKWIPTDPCIICQANAAVGAIPMKEPFPSGDQRVPAHPNCRCATAPVMLKVKQPPVVKAQPLSRPSLSRPSLSRPRPKTDAVKKRAADKGMTPQKWRRSITSEERRSINHFSAGDGKIDWFDIRAAQQAGTTTGDVATQVKHLTTAFNRAPKYEGRVFRGIYNLEQAEVDQLRRAKTITWDAMSSSSKSEFRAKTFLGSADNRHSVLFDIKSKTGVDIQGVVREAYRTEREVVLRKGTKYRITSVKEQVYKIEGEFQKATRITMEEM